MGPDEYHEAVDDNAFTNVMARWNLRTRRPLVDLGGGRRHRGGAVAEARSSPWSTAGTPTRGLYEQFAGYWDLEPLLSPMSPSRRSRADVLLGARSG